MAVYNMLLLVSLLWGLVAVVHCQTVPYVSFMGVNLPNHAYVIISDIGTTNDDTVILTVLLQLVVFTLEVPGLDQIRLKFCLVVVL